jgi:hypothetical protein
MRRIIPLATLVTGGLFLALMPASAPARPAKGPYTCKGSSSKPGVLSGKHTSGVDVKGYCYVNGGPAQVTGDLTVESGSVLIAAFGMHNSKLKVTGNLNVDTDSTLVLGCNTTSFPCIDDPKQSAPTLSSPGAVTGDIASTSPLGVIIHSTTIGGNVTQTNGGGGTSCSPPSSGPFALFQSPVYSDYEDNTITGNLKVTRVTSCYLGIIRNHVENLRVTYDTMGDPDAIEIETNVVKRNLACWHDRQHVWDSSETTQTGIYPRKLSRNTVHGKRVGQCVKAPPLTQGGPPAGGPF